ncbi:MAG: rRNA maturation RNase YbeY [Clostridia bacterium]|nr:rRNA maturation RNase YbeY [Clostridia bacterium]
MKKIAQIEYLDVEKNYDYEETINRVLKECFLEENLLNTNIYISVTLTNPENIRSINKEYRNIDKETDVLSFPMFEKDEIQAIIKNKEYKVNDVLGDIVISLEKVKEQAMEYGHSFERELAYMLVHGFYHLMGYDHIEEKDKVLMRPKEEKILQNLNITRE